MSHENREECCGSCKFSQALATPEEFMAANQALSKMRGRLYTDRCVKSGLLITKEDLPFTTRFPEETFPNPHAESCYSPVKAYSNLVT